MKLIVLGCSGPYPAAGGATSGYLLEADRKRFLLDCGSGVLSQLRKRMDPCDLSAVFLTHTHWDHMCDLFVLQYELEKNRCSLPLYVPVETDAAPLALLSGNAFHIIRYGRETLEFDNVSVDSCPVSHPVPCRALRFTAAGKSFVYTGDAATSEGLESFCRDIDLLLADSAFLADEWHPGVPHMHAAMAAKLAADCRADKLVVTHFPPHTARERIVGEAREVFANTVPAEIGLQIML